MYYLLWTMEEVSATGSGPAGSVIGQSIDQLPQSARRWTGGPCQDNNDRNLYECSIEKLILVYFKMRCLTSTLIYFRRGPRLHIQVPMSTGYLKYKSTAPSGAKHRQCPNAAPSGVEQKTAHSIVAIPVKERAVPHQVACISGLTMDRPSPAPVRSRPLFAAALYHKPFLQRLISFQPLQSFADSTVYPQRHGYLETFTGEVFCCHKYKSTSVITGNLLKKRV